MTDDKQLKVRFYRDGNVVDADDLPDDVWEIGARDSDRGFDHEAHEAATKILHLLQDEYEWAEDFDGAGLGY